MSDNPAMNGTHQGSAASAAKQGAATVARAATETDDTSKGGFFKLDPTEVAPGKLSRGVGEGDLKKCKRKTLRWYSSTVTVCQYSGVVSVCARC